MAADLGYDADVGNMLDELKRLDYVYYITSPSIRTKLTPAQRKEDAIDLNARTRADFDSMTYITAKRMSKDYAYKANRPIYGFSHADKAARLQIFRRTTKFLKTGTGTDAEVA